MEYTEIRRRRGRVPFGYEPNPERKGWLKPIPDQLDKLAEGFRYLDQGCSFREVATWITATTGTAISHVSLRENYQRDLAARIPRLVKQ